MNKLFPIIFLLCLPLLLPAQQLSVSLDLSDSRPAPMSSCRMGSSLHPAFHACLSRQ